MVEQFEFDIVKMFKNLISVILTLGRACMDFLGTEFKIGDLRVTALDMVGVSFVVLMGLWFVKKFVPLA